MSEDTSSDDGELKRRNYAGNPTYYQYDDLATVYGGERTKREKMRQTHLLRAFTGGLEMLYAVQFGDETVKIGYSSNLSKRVTFYRHSGGNLLAFMPGTLDDEKALHASLRRHIKRGREWYHPTPEVMAVVNTMRDHYSLPHVAA